MQLDLPSFVAKFEVSKVPFIAQVANSIQSIYLKRGDTKEKRAEMIQTIMDRQI
jgi:1-acyl-sn-glycerol-3-phosphate acyltransferase